MDTLVNLRVLCQSGRAVCRGGVSGLAAWLAQRAPLWVLVQVNALLLVPHLRIMTWNIWFADRDRAARTTALLAEISRLAPDVVLLQELLPETWDAIRARSGYAYSASQSLRFPYFVGILSRTAPLTDVVTTPFPDSPGGRCLLSATIRGVHVATAHFESGPANMDLRDAQIVAAARTHPVLLGGDFNWTEARPPIPFGYTLAARAALDAILVRRWERPISASSVLAGHGISDHDGLFVRL